MGRLPCPCHQVQAAGRLSTAGCWESGEPFCVKQKQVWQQQSCVIPKLVSPSYLKGERIRVVAGLLQQGFVHGAQAGLLALGVELEAVQPDILPEAQAHHVQVIAAVTEGTGQLHKH